MTISSSLISDRWASGACPPTRDQSRAFCEHLTRTQARNFYYGLKLLPEPKRSAMFALYAYMRLIDDIADDEDGRSVAQRHHDLEQWRLHTHAALAHKPLIGTATHPLWPAFAEMVHEYRLPAGLLDDVIAGQQQDLDPQPILTTDDLYTYCYRVAGTVGLASIYIWGFEGGAETEQLAIWRGVAFQLTNILRDLREDAERGRTYLPQSELAAKGITLHDLRAGLGGRAFRELMEGEIARAESFYANSRELEGRIERDSRPTLVAMTQIYHSLLRKLAVEPERVLRERISLSIMTKLLIGWRASWAR